MARPLELFSLKNRKKLHMDTCIKKEQKMNYKISIKPVEGRLPILHPTLRTYLTADFEASAQMVENTERCDADRQESYLYFDGDAEGCILRFSTEQHFTRFFERVIRSGRVNLCTLLPNTEYYAQVFSVGGEPLSEMVSFVTEASSVRPVWCTDEEGFGPRNVRDVGGYTTTYGKVKYGMLYRGTHLNNKYDNEYRTTDGVRDIMLKSLGIRSEIDVRVTGSDDLYYSENGEKIPQTANELDPSLPYYKLPLMAYDNVFPYSDRTASIPEIFRVLGRAENYPAYLHCNAGSDRTGTIIFLLHCLLGVGFVDAMHCYEMTTFSPQGKRSRMYVQQNDNVNYIAMGKFCKQLLTYGDNYQTATENFLRLLGLTNSEMDAVRELLIEKT